ncbi:ran guanine nucleotide release factor-like [Mytilus trossulus]|uniref:ran guanine nucleotide release factor-like n=1 Tax=Mytilus trossulus TaxID=6551 RepID=UPI0030045E21
MFLDFSPLLFSLSKLKFFVYFTIIHAEKYLMPERELFGGAFSAFLPDGAKDVSDFRQIPDNQEVFTHAETDQSVIIEIMEHVEGGDDVAIKTHFEDLAQGNDVSPQDSEITHTEQISDDKLSSEHFDSAWYILGQQDVAKFNEAAKNTISIHMGLIRLSEFESDILITFNDPVNIDPSSSSHHAVPTHCIRWSVEDFKQMLMSFKLHDSGIFGV